jgi:hypothetical protein
MQQDSVKARLLILYSRIVQRGRGLAVTKKIILVAAFFKVTNI